MAGAQGPPPSLDHALQGGGRAVLLIDQSKAFERLSPEWVRAILVWHRAPNWLARLIMAFIVGRQAVFVKPGGRR
eukprot:13660958-Alexandrium_andersonii.AAC.1